MRIFNFFGVIKLSFFIKINLNRSSFGWTALWWYLASPMRWWSSFLLFPYILFKKYPLGHFILFNKKKDVSLFVLIIFILLLYSVYKTYTELPWSRFLHWQQKLKSNSGKTSKINFICWTKCSSNLFRL